MASDVSLRIVGTWSRDQNGKSNAMTKQVGACCSSPAAICYWFIVSLMAWGVLSLIGIYWRLLSGSSASTCLFAMAMGSGELGRVGQLAGTLPGRFVAVDDERPESCTGALSSLRTRAKTLAGSNVVVGAIPMNLTAIVEWLAGRTDIAVVFRLVSKTLWAP